MVFTSHKDGSLFRARAPPQKAESSVERELRELRDLVSQKVAEKPSHESSHDRTSPQQHSGASTLLSKAKDYKPSDIQCKALWSGLSLACLVVKNGALKER